MRVLLQIRGDMSRPFTTHIHYFLRAPRRRAPSANTPGCKPVPAALIRGRRAKVARANAAPVGGAVRGNPFFRPPARPGVTKLTRVLATPLRAHSAARPVSMRGARFDEPRQKQPDNRIESPRGCHLLAQGRHMFPTQTARARVSRRESLFCDAACARRSVSRLAATDLRPEARRRNGRKRSQTVSIGHKRSQSVTTVHSRSEPDSRQ